MSFSIKQFITGIGLKPVSADPSNPTQGQLQYADGTVRAEGLWRYDGSAWQQVGSGAGSYDIFFQENLETNSASNFTTGQAASPDAVGTGTLGGTLANETSSQISGDRSLKYTMNATASSSNNDFIINDTDIALDAKQKGNFIGISFYYTYTGADDDIRFFVLDQDDNELTQSDEYIKANSTATRFSTSVFIPSSDTALRYGFQVVTGNSSKVFIVDDIEFSTNPFVYKDLVSFQTAQISQGNGHGSTNTKIRRFSTTDDSTGSGLFTFTDSATLGSYITFHKKSYVTITYSDTYSSGSTTFGLSRNSNQLTTNIGAITQANRLASTTTDQNNNPDTTSWAGYVNAGDVIRAHTDGFVNGTTNVHLGIQAIAETEHVVTPAKNYSEYYQVARTGNFWDGAASETTFDTSLIPLTGSQLVEWNDTTQTRLVAKKDVIVHATVHGQVDADAYNYIYNSSGEILSSNVARTDGASYPSASASVKLSQGDYIYFGSNNVASSREGGLTITVQQAEAQFLAAVPTQLTAIIEDVKADTVGGGTFTSGAWQTRVLNTLSGDTAFLSLSSNEFTLSSGKYIIDWSATAYDCGYHKSRLYDVTNATVEKYGSTLDTEVSANVCNKSEGKHVLTITSSTTYRIEHRCATTKSSTGFGPPVNLGGDNIFCSVKITKIK